MTNNYPYNCLWIYAMGAGITLYNLTDSKVEKKIYPAPGSIPFQQTSSTINSNNTIMWLTTGGSNNGSLIPFYLDTLESGTPIVIIPSTSYVSINEIILSPVNTNLYVIDDNYPNSNLYIVDTTTGTITNTISLGTSVSNAVINSNGTTIWFTNGNGQINSINLTTLTLGTAISVNSGNEYLAISPDDTTIWTTSFEGNTVQAIDIATGTITATLTLSAQPSYLIINPNGKTLYVSIQGGIQLIDISTLSLSTLITLNSPYESPSSFIFNSDRSLLYFSFNGTNTLNTATLEIIQILNNLNGNIEGVTIRYTTIVNSLIVNHHFINCNQISDIISHETGVDK